MELVGFGSEDVLDTFGVEIGVTTVMVVLVLVAPLKFVQVI